MHRRRVGEKDFAPLSVLDVNVVADVILIGPSRNHSEGSALKTCHDAYNLRRSLVFAMRGLLMKRLPRGGSVFRNEIFLST